MIGNRTVAHLENGLELIGSSSSPEIFYSTISGLCVELEMEQECHERFVAEKKTIDPSRAPLADYALGRLAIQDDSDMSFTYAYSSASSAYLTSRLARYIVDDAVEGVLNITRDELKSLWETTNHDDNASVGRRFGYAYLHIRDNAWDLAEVTLKDITKSHPNNIDAYRELGRIYFAIGDKEACYHVTNRALELSVASGDREGELNALGNLAYLNLRWNSASAEAKTSLLDVLKLAERIGDPSAIGINNFRLGELEARSAKYTRALGHLARAEEMMSYMPVTFRIQVLSTRGEILRRQLKYDEALGQLSKARQLIDVYDIEPNYNTLAVDAYLSQTYWQMGRIHEAIDMSRRSIIKADSLLLIDSMISLRGTLGQMYVDMHLYDRAIEAHKEALDLAIDDESEYRIYGAYIDLGYTYACAMNFDEAEYYFNLGIRASMSESDAVATGKALVGIGAIYNSVGNNELASVYFERALTLYNERDVPKLLGQVNLWLADVSRHRDDIELANVYLSRAEQHAVDDGMRFESQTMRAEMELSAGRYDSALSRFDRALALSQLPLHAWRSHMGRAIALWELRRPAEAVDEFEAALGEVEHRRGREMLAVDRSLMAASRYDLYETFASFLDSQGQYEYAIHIDERGRSRTLLDLLFTTQRSRGRGDGVGVERAISTRIRSDGLALEESELLSVGDLSVLQRERLEDIAKERQSVDDLFNGLQRRLLGSDPLYAYAPAETDAIQRILEPEEAIVLYSLRDESMRGMGSSVAYVVWPDSIAFVALRHDPTTLEESVRFFRDAITSAQSGPSSDWEPNARQLYEWLIAPVRPFLGPETTHLHIIPGGPLHYLPFAALQDGLGNFLVERFDLSYSPSLTLLKLSREQNPMKWSRMLLFADPDNNLPGARHEASIIAAKRPNDRRLVVGDEATQELLRREAPEYDILHFATHGEFTSRTPLASQIKLSNDSLTVDEIGELNLNAYLVTLSACETARSGGLIHDSAPGEEWIGMYQAFLAAGTPTVVASLWTINDRYSGPLMSKFYDHLETRGKARALAEVQRGFIATQQMSHPYFWAAFSVLGDPL